MALGGAVSLALAGLVKIPAILVLAPIAVVGWLRHGWRLWRDEWFVAAPLAALGAVALWYLHADQIYQETGLTQAIFRPSGTYPIDIGQWAGAFTTVSHWTRPEQLTWDTASLLLTQFWELHLTPAFAVIAVIGALRWHWPLAGRAVVDAWMLAAAALVAVSLQGQIFHEFHQLPTLPPLALYFGMGAAPLFDGRTYARLTGLRRPLAVAAVAALLAVVAVRGFADSGVIRRLYRPDQLNTPIMDAGAAIDARTPKDALLATVEYERYGSNSPMLLYFAHRKGWSFDQVSISPQRHRVPCGPSAASATSRSPTGRASKRRAPTSSSTCGRSRTSICPTPTECTNWWTSAAVRTSRREAPGDGHAMLVRR